jgi:hypothetical protein
MRRPNGMVVPAESVMNTVDLGRRGAPHVNASLQHNDVKVQLRFAGVLSRMWGHRFEKAHLTGLPLNILRLPVGVSALQCRALPFDVEVDLTAALREAALRLAESGAIVKSGV